MKEPELKKQIDIKRCLDFCFFVCLMVYQPSWIIKFQSYPCRKTVMVLFKQQQRGIKGIHTFPRGISPKVNKIT